MYHGIKETVYTIDCHRLQEYILKIYGHDYDIIGYEGWGNDSYQRIEVNGEIEDWRVEDVDAFRFKGDMQERLLRSLMNDMAARELIEKGAWFIHVYW